MSLKLQTCTLTNLEILDRLPYSRCYMAEYAPIRIHGDKFWRIGYPTFLRDNYGSEFLENPFVFSSQSGEWRLSRW